MIQHIAFNEFLPVVLGKNMIAKFNLLLQKEVLLFRHELAIDLKDDGEILIILGLLEWIRPNGQSRHHVLIRSDSFPFWPHYSAN
jgi:hypothetical protein